MKLNIDSYNLLVVYFRNKQYTVLFTITNTRDNITFILNKHLALFVYTLICIAVTLFRCKFVRRFSIEILVDYRYVGVLTVVCISVPFAWN